LVWKYDGDQFPSKFLDTANHFINHSFKVFGDDSHSFPIVAVVCPRYALIRQPMPELQQISGARNRVQPLIPQTRDAVYMHSAHQPASTERLESDRYPFPDFVSVKSVTVKHNSIHNIEEVGNPQS
jgi:hypothetical protein